MAFLESVEINSFDQDITMGNKAAGRSYRLPCFSVIF